jgi:hypothetical protein
MNISSRKKLINQAENLLKVIKEETEGIDKKVETSVKKMKEFCTEKQDQTSGLIELAKLVDEKQYSDILGSIKDIEKVNLKLQEDGAFVDTHYLYKYRESIKAVLMIKAHTKFNNKECALIISCF